MVFVSAEPDWLLEYNYFCGGIWLEGEASPKIVP